MRYKIVVLLLLIAISLQAQKKNRPSALQNDKFFSRNGKEMLYGGDKPQQDFVIDNLELERDQFHYGLGREHFPALIDPEFISVSKADKRWSDSSRFLLVHYQDEAKAYAVRDLTRHEIVNDSINGQPIMATYCVLADLGAVYDRKYDEKVFTFGLSGYTYYDPEVWDGLDAFVFWDRETESLWWPLIDKAITGKMKGTQLLLHDENHWEDTNWKYVKENYPQAKVLQSGQDMNPPENWRSYDDVSAIVEKYHKE